MLSRNPTQEKIALLCKESKHNAAKWIKDDETGDVYYWPAEYAQHAAMAKMLHINNYEKGLAIPACPE